MGLTIRILAIPFLALVLGSGATGATITQETEDRALQILDRITARDPLADDRFVAALERRVGALTGTAKLHAMHELLYFESLGSGSAESAIQAIAGEARAQDNERYAAIARARLVYLQFKKDKKDTAVPRLQAELDAAADRGDWLAETQIRRLMTYMLWSLGHRETAMQILQEAFEKVPERAPEADFARMTLLDALEFIHADSGDLNALIETAEQMLSIAERAEMPINGELIVRDFAYLFRVRGAYGIALEFYQEYDRLLREGGQTAQRYVALFWLALTAQRMDDFALSYEYAAEAKETPDLPGTYEAGLNIIQAINEARVGSPALARSNLQEAKGYFEGSEEAGSELWKIELLRAEAEVSRAIGDHDLAFALLTDYAQRSVSTIRQVSASEVEKLRAQLSAELARQRAERALLERDQQLNRQRIRMQTLALVLLGLLMTALTVAYIQQRRGAKALEESRKKAEAANEAKSRFLANVSHELRTPLNAVIGFSDMLVQTGAGKMGPERVEEYAGLINQSGRHLLDVIADLLDVSQIESGGIELSVSACTLSEIAADAMNIVAPQADAAGKRIDLDLPEDLPPLLADRRRTKQAVINLLSNALKFTRQDARITLAARRTEDGGLAIEVADNGIGIPPDKIEAVLDPFVQVDDGWNRTHHGVGLGLSIVRTIVEAHGGRLGVESRVGDGTRITITLPPDCVAEATSKMPERSAKTAVA